MKTKLITGALIISASLLSAQENDKPVTVRIKKVENVNGVEKITDTTFTTTDGGNWKSYAGEEIKIIENEAGKDGSKNVVIINDHKVNGNNPVEIKTIDGANLDKEIEKALKEAGIDPAKVQESKGTKKMIVVTADSEVNKEGGNEIKTTKVIVIKKANITDASPSDLNIVNKQTGVSDNKLTVERMEFFPNPNNGKFNLSFQLKDKSLTDIAIMNIEGKVIYKEQLKDFSGSYNKEIDISSNPKGVYLVKVKQNEHALVKKIVLE